MTAVDDLRTAAKLLHKRHQPRPANWLTNIANTWKTDPKSKEQQVALLLARKVLKAAKLPDHVAVMVRGGHLFEAVPLRGSTLVWGCLICGDTVSDSGTAIYGAATRRACGRRTARKGGGR